MQTRPPLMDKNNWIKQEINLVKSLVSLSILLEGHLDAYRGVSSVLKNDDFYLNINIL